MVSRGIARSVTAGVLLVSAFAFGQREPDKRETLVKAGELAPKFFLRDLGGDYVKLRSFCWEEGYEKGGKKRMVGVIHFWAMDCIPCLKELPLWNKLLAEWNDKPVKVFLISTDKDGEAKLREFAKKHGIEPHVLMDPYKVAADRYGVKGLPVTVVCDGHRKVAKVWLGKMTDEGKELRKLVAAMAKP